MNGRIFLTAAGAAAMSAFGFQTGAGAAQPEPWQIDFQTPATPMMERIYDMNVLLTVIIVLITIFVLALLTYVVLKFREDRNPTPSKTTHNTLIEVIWTVVPIMILVLIAIPSFKLLYFNDVIPKADMTIKAIGHQWYWSYEYPDHGDISFDAIMLEEEELQPGQPRLLQTDTEVVVPVDTTVKVLVTASDVLHAWTIPAFGAKIDAVPGRINETWFKAMREGTYYGQCSELCGTNHGFMPITVRVVSRAEFDNWVAEQQAAMNPPAEGALIADATRE